MPHLTNQFRFPTRQLRIHRVLDASRRLALGLLAGMALASGMAAAPAEAASCIAPSPAPHAWWKLDTTSFGTTPELLAQNHATLHGNPQQISGYVGQSMELDGNDYLEAEDCHNVDIGTADFTLVAWIRPDASLTGARGTIVSKREQQGTLVVGYQFQMYSGALLLQMGDTTSGHLNYTTNLLSPALTDGDWHLVAVSVDRDSTTGLRFYVDGTLEATRNPTSRQDSLNSAGELRMGRASAPANATYDDYFEGDLDEVQIYKRALTASEIQAIFNAGPSGMCTRGLPALQSCNDNSSL